MKHLKSFNEDITSFNFEEELQEFCEMNLAYLLDEAELQVVPSFSWAELHLIRIMLNEPKRWDEIKDYMIPFLTRLVSKYEISNQPFRNLYTWNAKKDPKSVENIRLHISFYGNHRPDTASISASSYMRCQIKDLIEDKNTRPTLLNSSARISDIRFYVKGYKQPKKSILTKIKSFFK